VIARHTSHQAAHALAERIADALRDAEPWRGAPLIAGVGVAVLGEDGRTGQELIEAAEEARFRASASGDPAGGA
jgi:GGDEF domain-containing protein